MQPLPSHAAVSFVLGEPCLWCSDDRVLLFLAVDISTSGFVGADFEYETPYVVVYINYFVNVVVELVVAMGTQLFLVFLFSSKYLLLMFFLFTYLGMLVPWLSVCCRSSSIGLCSTNLGCSCLCSFYFGDFRFGSLNFRNR